jgi:hypothetical protein
LFVARKSRLLLTVARLWFLSEMQFCKQCWVVSEGLTLGKIAAQIFKLKKIDKILKLKKEK